MKRRNKLITSILAGALLFSCSENSVTSVNRSSETTAQTTLSESVEAIEILENSPLQERGIAGKNTYVVMLWDGFGKDGKIKTAFSDAEKRVSGSVRYQGNYISDRGQSVSETKKLVDNAITKLGKSRSEVGLLLIGKSMGGAKTYKMAHDYESSFDDFNKVAVVLIDAHEGGAPGNQGISGKWYDYVRFRDNTKWRTRDYDLEFTSRYRDYGSNKLHVYNTYQRDDLLEGYSFSGANQNKRQHISRDGHEKITTTSTTKDMIEDAIIFLTTNE